MEGQRSSYVELEKAMRAYMHQHRSEFLEEGQETDNSSITDTSSIISNRDGLTSPTSTTHHHHALNDENPTVDTSLRTGEGSAIPYLRPFIEFSTMLFDLIGDLIGGMTVTSGALAFVVVVLVLSNIWTLSSRPKIVSTPSSRSLTSPSTSSNSNSNSETYNNLHSVEGGQRTPDEVASAVRSVLQDYFAGLPASTASSTNENVRVEGKEVVVDKRIVDLTALIERLEKRIGVLEGTTPEEE